MAQQKFLRIALPTPLRRLFDYLPPQDIDCTKVTTGVRVAVPFQSRTLIGLLIEVVDKTTVPLGKLKQAVEILDDQAVLTQDVYQLCLWAADYYHYSLGEVLVNSALPAAARKGKKIPHISTSDDSSDDVASSINSILTLNTAQQAAVSAISSAQHQFRVFLLDGVTGSGKTEVYLRTIEYVIANQQQVLVLIPEISLTPQTIDRFRMRFKVNVVALHSGLSTQKRFNGWCAARAGDAMIVIGTRSAIFTPLPRLGLIIVDEEHDASFKQQDRFRYHARDLAIMRANINNIPIVLGSATPSLESLLNAKRGRYDYLSLPNRAGTACMPAYQLIDMRKASVEEGLSTHLLEMMHIHLEQDHQVMLFLNRRGFAPVLYCPHCAWVAGCKRCDSRMVYHRQPLRLQCHHCDAKMGIPLQCDQCQETNLQPLGLGTQRLEQALEKHFPHIPIIRVDRDSTRKKDAMQDLLDQVNTQQKAILLGTQMLAKGHHFPQVTLVGIVDADSGLFSADFRAAESMGQLFVQVAGRAGREKQSGTVAIQTRHPDHPLLQTLILQGYQPYAQSLLVEREQAMLPPFSYFAVFRAEAYAEENAAQFLDTIKKLSVTLTDAVSILGPVPLFLTKRKGLYCQQLLIRSQRRSALQHFLTAILQQIDKLPGKSLVKWVLDVDPVEVL